MQRADDELQRGRLARPIGTDETRDDAARGLEGGAVDSVNAAEVDVQVPDLEDVRGESVRARPVGPSGALGVHRLRRHRSACGPGSRVLATAKRRRRSGIKPWGRQ